MLINQRKEEFQILIALKNLTKVKNVESEIASVCKKKTIQFNINRLKDYCLI